MIWSNLMRKAFSFETFMSCSFHWHEFIYIDIQMAASWKLVQKAIGELAFQNREWWTAEWAYDKIYVFFIIHRLYERVKVLHNTYNTTAPQVFHYLLHTKPLNKNKLGKSWTYPPGLKAKCCQEKWENVNALGGTVRMRGITWRTLPYVANLRYSVNVANANWSSSDYLGEKRSARVHAYTIAGECFCGDTILGNRGSAIQSGTIMWTGTQVRRFGWLCRFSSSVAAHISPSSTKFFYWNLSFACASLFAPFRNGETITSIFTSCRSSIRKAGRYHYRTSISRWYLLQNTLRHLHLRRARDKSDRLPKDRTQVQRLH